MDVKLYDVSYAISIVSESARFQTSDHVQQEKPLQKHAGC